MKHHVNTHNPTKETCQRYYSMLCGRPLRNDSRNPTYLASRKCWQRGSMSCALHAHGPQPDICDITLLCFNLSCRNASRLFKMPFMLMHNTLLEDMNHLDEQLDTAPLSVFLFRTDSFSLSLCPFFC